MRTVIIITLSITVLLSFTACDEGLVPPPGLPYSNTPAEVLEQIEDSFLVRDVTDLEGLLTADFTFHFDDDDVGKQVGEYTVPESWTSGDFLNPVSRIFNNAHSVEISIVTANIGEPDSDDTAYTADNVQIRFLVMVEPYYGYFAQGFVTFEFGVEYNEKDEKEWLVTGWRDDTSPAGTGGRNVTEASFGEILVGFRKP